jgi:hypothetical protein
MSEEAQHPENPGPKAGEAGFGPGEKGDSIEEGRENAKREEQEKKESDDD